MDQGVIEALKAFYHTSVVRRHIKYINPGETFPNISILETMRVWSSHDTLWLQTL